MPLGAATTLNLLQIGTLTYFFVQLVLKPLIARYLVDPKGPSFDAIVPATSAAIAGGLIALASYFPQVYGVVESSVLVATGGVGLNRISKTAVSSKPTPAATPTDATPAPAPAS